jgi:tRNA G18 (ribose-2'-O)-methylase SpoU
MKKLRKLNIYELNRKSIDEYRKSPKLQVIVVLDNLRSLNNIGSIFRTCDALNVESVFLCGISATPPHPEIHKTALGAEDSVSWIYFDKTTDALKQLKEKGYEIFALEQTENSLNLQYFDPKANIKYAFVFGNELKGVTQEALDFCDSSLEIPQFGTKHSFNVSITAGIVIWDFFSKLNTKKKVLE